MDVSNNIARIICLIDVSNNIARIICLMNITGIVLYILPDDYILLIH